MKKSRLLAAISYLVLGMWLGSSRLDTATAQSSSLTFPLKLAQTQPPSPSSTPRLGVNLEAIEFKSFFTPSPISPACPFPPISISEAIFNVLFIPDDSTDAESAAYSEAITLLAITNRYASVGRTDQAVELLPEISEIAKTLPRQNSLTVNVLYGTAELYATVGQRERAAEVLSDALQVVENIEETFVKALALTQIADGYAQLKQPDRATELLSQALELTESEQGLSEKNLVRVAIARSYGVLGQFDQAFQVTNAVEPTSLRDQVKQTLDCSREAG